MLKNCLFGTYRASATTTFVFSIVSRYPATIRIDNATSAQSSGAPLSQLRAEEERLRNSRRNCDPVHLYLPSTVQEIAVSSHAAPAISSDCLSRMGDQHVVRMCWQTWN